MDIDGDDDELKAGNNENEESSSEEEDVDEQQADGGKKVFQEMLQLPTIDLSPISRSRLERRINYHKFILLTQEEYICAGVGECCS